MALAYGIGGLVGVQTAVKSGPAAPAFNGSLGEMYYDTSTTPPTQYFYNGSSWLVGGNAYATTSDPGIVQLSADIATDYPSSTLVPTVTATKDYVDGVAMQGAAVSTETVMGIGQLATDAEAVAGTASTP